MSHAATGSGDDMLTKLLCRGFAFVDFLSKQEARSAADAVAGTHLYGRRLVSQS